MRQELNFSLLKFVVTQAPVCKMIKQAAQPNSLASRQVNCCETTITEGRMRCQRGKLDVIFLTEDVHSSIRDRSESLPQIRYFFRSVKCVNSWFLIVLPRGQPQRPSTMPLGLFELSVIVSSTTYNHRATTFLRPDSTYGRSETSTPCRKCAKHVRNVLCEGRNATAR